MHLQCAVLPGVVEEENYGGSKDDFHYVADLYCSVILSDVYR